MDAANNDINRGRVFAAAAILVLFRCLVPGYYNGFNFGSDQAIVGLMARHLSTLREFPLYYYGLNYLLGVEAWIIAPFFRLFRPSVAVMRLPLIILNITVALWLITEIARRFRLSHATAFVAALPFIMPTPAAGSQLLNMGGACIEPFVYILFLWRLRARPFAFGLLLAFGTLHREFTIFALPALVLVEAADGGWQTLATWTNLRRAARMASGFALVWLIVDDLKLHLSGTALTLQISSLGNQMCLDGGTRERVVTLVRQALPALFGGYAAETPLVTGYRSVGWMLALAALVVVGRLVLNRRESARANVESGFGAYLMWLGAMTACAYPLSCNIVFGGPPLLRYLLFGLLIPVGLFAVFMSREKSRALKTALTVVFVLWGSVNFFDNARLVVAAVRNPPVDEHGELADYLVSHHIGYARATYWDAYVLDFLTQERTIVASTDTIRIPKYQTDVEAHAKEAVNLVRQPCTGLETVAAWCIEK